MCRQHDCGLMEAAMWSAGGGRAPCSTRAMVSQTGSSRAISGNLGESRRISRRARARWSRRRAARRRRRRGRPRPGGSRQPSFTGMDTRASGAAAARQVRASGGWSVRLQAFDRAGSAGALFRRWFGRRGLRRSSISRAEIVDLAGGDRRSRGRRSSPSRACCLPHLGVRAGDARSELSSPSAGEAHGA